MKEGSDEAKTSKFLMSKKSPISIMFGACDICHKLQL